MTQDTIGIPDHLTVEEKTASIRKLISGVASLPLLFLASAMVTIPIIFFNPHLAFRMEVALPLTIVAEFIAIVAGLTIGWPTSQWKQALGFRKPKLSGLFIAAGLGLSLFLLLQALGIFFSQQGVVLESSDTSDNLEKLTGSSRILVFFVMSPFVVPVVEEVFFRGWVFSAFYESYSLGRFRVWAAVLLPAIFFSLMHVQGFSTFTDFFIPAWILFMALIQAFLMLRYKSIFVVIALHLVYNGITVLVSVLG